MSAWLELMRYQQSRVQVDEFRVATKEGDQCFLLAQAETSEKPPFGESGNPGRLCIGRC